MTKTHHALVDGVSGVDIATVLFDVKPVPEPIEPDRDWVPQPSPSSAELAARGVAELSETPFKLARRAVRAASHPDANDPQGGRGGRGARRGGLELHQPGARRPAQHRDRLAPALRLDPRGARQTSSGSRTRSAAPSTTSCSTVVSGALRSWLRSRGLKTEGLELRALVPVSIRAEDEHGQLGNRIAAMRGPLPVYIEDPVKRLDAVKQRDGRA